MKVPFKQLFLGGKKNKNKKLPLCETGTCFYYEHINLDLFKGKLSFSLFILIICINYCLHFISHGSFNTAILSVALYLEGFLSLVWVKFSVNLHKLHPLDTLQPRKEQSSLFIGQMRGEENSLNQAFSFSNVSKFL